MRLGLRPIGAYAPEGTEEETPGKHFHLQITPKYIIDSIRSHDANIFGEISVKIRLRLVKKLTTLNTEL
jgi:hypothetical protein